jgi:hypothetical protein
MLLHNNACLHTAAHTVETLKKLNFEVLEHPSYNPDLAPLDCHLFGPLNLHSPCILATEQPQPLKYFALNAMGHLGKLYPFLTPH